MQLIANQFRIVMRETVTLLWLILRETALLLAQLGKRTYANRRQIIRHEATPWVIIGIATLWSLWGMYQHTQQQNQREARLATIPAVLISDSAYQKQSTKLTGNQPSAESSKALAQSVFTWIGVPHRDGGDTRTGTDCSGLVRNVYQEAYGLTLNRSADKMYREDVEPIDKEELQEGDLVFFDTFGSGISHVGIFLQNGRFVHTSTTRGVTIDSLTNPYYADCYYAGGRVAP